MKLICPNCQAQYEIPDVAIPETGRDVQCANCEETWFQARPDVKTEPDQGGAEGDVGADTTPIAQKPSELKASEPKASELKVSEPKPSEPKPSEPSAAEPVPVVEPAAPRRELSPAVSDILRQEAAREKEARSAKEKTTAGAQTAGAPKDSSADTRPGRDRLPEIPDIDDNNPRLVAERPGDTVFDVDMDPPKVARKKGFKRGFALILLLIGLALAVYVFAPQLAQKYPNLREPLITYVNAINSGRLWLNDLVSSLMAK